MMKKIIDLRSDTVTRPTAAMREAMSKAEVGDDVFGDDPTVNKLQEVVAGLKALGDFETQSIFVDGSVSNCDDVAVKSWLAVMLELKPKAVQIYTLARPPADSELKAVSRERMNAIFLQGKKAGLILPYRLLESPAQLAELNKNQSGWYIFQ